MKDSLFGDGVIFANITPCHERIYAQCPYKNNDYDTCKMCIRDSIQFLYDRLHRIERKEKSNETQENGQIKRCWCFQKDIQQDKED